MNPLILAISVLTRIPMPNISNLSDKVYSRAFIFFPVVGLLLGLAFLAMAKVSEAVGINHMITSFAIVLLLSLVSGGLHLDGLADSADGLFSGKGEEISLAIMKESQVGSFGMAAIVLVLMGKFASIYVLLLNGSYAGIVIALVVSRWAMGLASFKASYPRESGTGMPFIGKPQIDDLIFSTALTFAIVAVFAGLTAIVFVLPVLLLVFSVRLLAQKKIGGVTGDILGAVNELAELLVLLTFSLF